MAPNTLAANPSPLNLSAPKCGPTSHKAKSQLSHMSELHQRVNMACFNCRVTLSLNCHPKILMCVHSFTPLLVIDHSTRYIQNLLLQVWIECYQSDWMNQLSTHYHYVIHVLLDFVGIYLFIMKAQQTQILASLQFLVKDLILMFLQILPMQNSTSSSSLGDSHARFVISDFGFVSDT